MQINHRIANVTGPFDTDTGRLVCVPMPKHGEVLLCFEEQMNIPFAKIKLHSEDRYVDASAVLPDATALGKEIVARWNELPGILEDFVRAMDECGSWPDEDADLMRLAEIAHRARCHMKGIPHERRCPRPLPTN